MPGTEQSKIPNFICTLCVCFEIGVWGPTFGTERRSHWHSSRETHSSPCLHVSAPLSSSVDIKTALHIHAPFWGWDHYIKRQIWSRKFSFYKAPIHSFWGPVILIHAAIRHFNSQHWKGYAIRAQECWKSPEVPLTRSPRWFSGLPLSETGRVGIYVYKRPKWEAEGSFHVKQLSTLAPQMETGAASDPQETWGGPQQTHCFQAGPLPRTASSTQLGSARAKEIEEHLTVTEHWEIYFSFCLSFLTSLVSIFLSRPYDTGFLKFIEGWALSFFINVPCMLKNKYAPGIGDVF